MIKTSLLVGLLALSATQPAFALRCGHKIVSDGDPIIKVLKYCGEPAATSQRSILRAGFPRIRQAVAADGRIIRQQELLIHTHSYVEVLVEEWTYNFGPNRLMRLIRFEDGLVTEVKQLGYGFRD